MDKYFKTKLLKYIFILIPILTTKFLYAQENESSRPWNFTLLTGQMFPQNVSGYHENLGIAGLRIGTSIETFLPELIINGGYGKGQSYQSAWFSLKNSLDPFNLDEFKTHWYLGLQYTRYRRPDFQGYEFPYFQVSGPHFGFGMEAEITKRFSLRSDFYFGLNPGRVLLFVFGFESKFGGILENKN